MNPHDEVTDRLSEYIDGELTAAEAAAIERHLASCAACREITADLRSIAQAAPGLPHTPPDRDLWDGVAVRIGAQADGQVVPFGRGAARRFSFTLPQLAAAAVALMVLTGSAVLMMLPQANRTGGEPTAAGQPWLATDASPVALVDPQFDSAVADLEAALDQGRSKLDPETVRVLEQNLQTIDQAIQQSRRALEADPANAFLNSHLAAARHRKLALLRTATALTAGS